jgi:beta-alanine degradation protein BauB
MRKIVSIFLLFVFAFGLSCTVAVAQDPVKVAPSLHKILFENERVRVYEVNAKAGDKVGTHSHSDHILYFVTDTKAKITGADGKSNEVDGKAGTAAWTDAVTHTTEFVTAGRVLVVELKK